MAKGGGVFLILDFGSQYTWLIARTFRELGFYCLVKGFDFPLEKIKNLKPSGIVISGGPASVWDNSSPSRSLKELAETAPLLGVCYGFQMLCHQWGGEVKAGSGLRAYGKSRILWTEEGKDMARALSLFPGVLHFHEVPHYSRGSFLKSHRDFKSLEGGNPEMQHSSNKEKQSLWVWMSHGDFVSKIPPNFHVWAKTDKGVPAILFHKGDGGIKKILAVQFHPEVSHTDRGQNIILYFARQICGVKKGSWTPSAMLDHVKSQVQKTLKAEDQILCALSGGVDSTVTAVLLTHVMGKKKVQCVFVDTGLLRQGEFKEVLLLYKKLNLNVKGVQASEEFLNVLKGVSDPEQKRKIIGKKFIDIFKKYASQHPCLNCLAQGTLYPDVIESLSPEGAGVTIKSHHNVGGLPKALPFKLVEPLRELFKDEVRLLGQELCVPEKFLNRHPFPGPGLAVRIVGELSPSRVEKLRKADAIFMEELRLSGLYGKIWQAFCVLLDTRSVGVQGDSRSYDEVLALRAITSRDGMTADWFAFEAGFLHKVSDRITNEVKGINRVVYDVTSKPPGTIEWL